MGEANVGLIINEVLQWIFILGIGIAVFIGIKMILNVVGQIP